MKKDTKINTQAWGEFRFSVVGPLLSAPPCKGELKKTINELSSKIWKHPLTAKPLKLGASTIERWYYTAHKEKRSAIVPRLCRKIRNDQGLSRCMSEEVKAILKDQYQEHKSWSRKLHSDNLEVQLNDLKTSSKKEILIPSYPTIIRHMHHQGMVRIASLKTNNTEGQRKALSKHENIEVRTFESQYVGSLFHLDFHHCSRQVLLSDGKYVTPLALAIMDDCSRFICHLQWYLSEQTEDLVHGVIQALLKVGLPRALMSDNGAAMTSAEFTRGLTKLGIVHNTTLPYSPYQNGKQERFFQSLEGRLLALFENIPDLTLIRLNHATQAWLEVEYQRAINKELGVSPVRKYLDSKQVLRPSPVLNKLKIAFRNLFVRRQRRTDGTISLNGVRFEIPSPYRTLKDIYIEAASWDLSFAHLVDKKSGTVLSQIFPLDKLSNASGKRKLLAPLSSGTTSNNDSDKNNTSTNKELSKEEPPLLRKLLADFAATGIPPSYIPKDSEKK